MLDRPTARQIVSAAAAIYYPERSWRAVLRGAGPLPSALVDFLTPLDLKRQDAERALACAKQLLGDADRLARQHGRRGDAPFTRSEATRERGYDATGGMDPAHLRARLAEWLIGSGRLVRHLPAALPPPEAPVDLDALARSVWQGLEQSRRLDAELMRLHAVTRAARAADDADLAPRPCDLRLAQDEIATNHGVGSWNRLVVSPRGRQFAGPIAEARERLARAKRMRDVWFEASSRTAAGDGAPPSAPNAWAKVRALLHRRHSQA